MPNPDSPLSNLEIPLTDSDLVRNLILALGTPFPQMGSIAQALTVNTLDELLPEQRSKAAAFVRALLGIDPNDMSDAERLFVTRNNVNYNYLLELYDRIIRLGTSDLIDFGSLDLRVSRSDVTSELDQRVTTIGIAVDNNSSIYPTSLLNQIKAKLSDPADQELLLRSYNSLFNQGQDQQAPVVQTKAGAAVALLALDSSIQPSNPEDLSSQLKPAVKELLEAAQQAEKWRVVIPVLGERMLSGSSLVGEHYPSWFLMEVLIPAVDEYLLDHTDHSVVEVVLARQ